MKNTKTAIAPFTVTLAHKRSEKLDVTKGVFIQPKLDGVRCYTRLVDGEVKMFSRNHKEFKNCKHLTTALKPFFEDNNNVILDGELYNHNFKDNFNKIISLVRKTKPTQADRFESASLLQYHVYDIYAHWGPEAPYGRRMAWLNVLHAYNCRGIKRVRTTKVESQELVDIVHKVNKDDGYEGSMLRGDVAYEQKRSYNLQKVKDWHDTEFIITGFIEGKGKFSGGLGKFIGFDDIGREVEVPWPDITIAKRREVWENRQELRGKQATFEYFERTPGGAYRFPRFKGIRDYE